MFRNLPIGVKLLLIVAIPLVALLALAAVNVQRSIGDAQNVLEVTSEAGVAAEAAAVLEAVQAERSAVVTATASGDDTTAEAVAATQADTDERIDAYEFIRQDLSEESAELLTSSDLRAEIDAARAEAAGADVVGVLASYDEVVEDLNEVNDAVIENLERVVDSESSEAIGALTRGIDLLAQERDILNAALIVGTFDDDLYEQAVGTRGAATAFLAEAGESVDEATQATLTAATSEAAAAEVAQIRDALQAGEENADVQGFVERSSTWLEELGNARAAIGASLVADADESGQSQQISALFLALAGTVVILAVMGLSFLMARTLSDNVRNLTLSARRVAETDLPEAVEQIRLLEEGDPRPELQPFRSGTADELGTMAQALTRIQDSALDAAYEQNQNERAAQEMLVNLGRRNQALLNRTLSYLSELERDEEDNETLEQLFRLDHLATRIRRNAESMLVLAGSEQTRTWRAPVAMIDVLRSSLSEIEEYERIDLHTVEEVKVNGSVVADVAHLLAELMENATRFSSDEERVTIVGRMAQDSYILSITDRGIGMGEQELAEANRRIRRAGLDRPDSKVLGHYVVGRLAGRRDIGVELLANDMGGVTVRVGLPQHLLVPTEPATPELHPQAGPQPQPVAQPQPVFDAPTDPQPVAAAQAQPQPASETPAPAPFPAQPQTPAPLAPAASADEWSTLAQNGTELPARTAAPTAPASSAAELPSFEPGREAPAVPETTAPEQPRRVTPLREEHGNIPSEWGSFPQRQPHQAPQPTAADGWPDLPARTPVDASVATANRHSPATTPAGGVSADSRSAGTGDAPAGELPTRPQRRPGSAQPNGAGVGRRVRGAQLPDTGPVASQQLPQREPEHVRNSLAGLQRGVSMARKSSTVQQPPAADPAGGTAAPAPRVRGAQMPDTGPDDQAGSATHRPADQVRSSLAGFQSSVSRARREAQDTDPNTIPGGTR
ncbi:nitrate- and nitrite sensing domain-containing protein [Euzebya tangerina]|uniref:sensor histidine kinase n=1 Tax=Euzebya tangerina TaxID=591198 RepID=UPI000E30CB62|nr:nitrate- and nitrite sensing domain-containing protein [Euzebya tangerina]